MMILDHQALVDATLRLLDGHLTAAGLPTTTHDLLFRTAADTLQAPHRPVGWLLLYAGDTTCVHVDLVTIVLLLQHANGRLAHLVDLEALWRQGAGDAHLLREAADRMPAAPPAVAPMDWSKP